MDCVNAEALEFSADVDSGEHSGVGGGLFSVSLNLHTTGDTGVGFTAGEISDVDESVVEGGLDVADTEDVFGLLGGTNLGGTVVGDLFLLCFGSFGRDLLLLCLGLY